MMAKRVVRNRACRASATDGTASLANRDFGRVVPANGPKVVFSGAAKPANDAAIARYLADSSRESADPGTRWRREGDSNSRDPSGFYGRNSARAWRTIRPEKKHPCWRESVRLEFGSSSDLSGSLRSPRPMRGIV